MYTERLIVSGAKQFAPDIWQGFSLARHPKVITSYILGSVYVLIFLLNSSHRLVEEMCRTLGLKSFTTVGVMHTAKCHGAIIKHTDGWSIVFV